MNDQSDETDRPPKYGGPRDRQRMRPGRRRSDDRPHTGAETRPHREASAFESPVDDLLEAFAVLDFDTEAQKRVYRYVERRGVASDDEIHERIDFPTEEVAIAIQWLVQQDYLEADDGTFRVAHGTGGEKTYRLGGTDVTIRPARQEDLADLVDLIRDVTDDRTYVVAESVAAQLVAEETVIRDTDAHSRLFFVATVDDGPVGNPQLVGWAHLTLPSIEYLDHTAELTVGVRPDFRRRGIGTRLSGIAVAWAAANGYGKVYQNLPETNRAAIDFLRNHGWRIEATRPDHYRIDGEFVDEAMMAVRL
jgi:ribosomal protein S18 acetylase RimI-like enzyme